MSEPSYYERRKKATSDIETKLFYTYEVKKPIIKTEFYYMVAYKYGLGKKFVDETLNHLIEINNINIEKHNAEINTEPQNKETITGDE